MVSWTPTIGELMPSNRRYFKAPAQKGTTRVPVTQLPIGKKGLPFLPKSPHQLAGQIAIELLLWIYQLPGNQEGADVTIGGYNKLFDCKPATATSLWFAGNPADICYTGAFQGNRWQAVGTAGLAFDYIRIWTEGATIFGVQRWDVASVWEKTGSPTQAEPQFVNPEAFAPDEYAPPGDLPYHVDPWYLPVHAPIPVPDPLPFKVIPHVQPNPRRAPSERDQRGNRAPFVHPGNDLKPTPSPDQPSENDPALRPRARPLPGVGPTIQIDPGGITFKPPTHRPAPPSGRTKERKFIANLPPGTFARIINNITETVDVIDAIHDALPEDCQKGDTPQAKLQDLYNCYHRLDVGQAMINLRNEAAEDKIFGRIGSGAGKGSEALFGNRPVGPGTGPAL